MGTNVISIKIKDQEFSHAPTAGNCMSTSFKSKNIEWYRGDDYRDITIFTKRMFNMVDSCDSKYKIAWLCEPKAINTASYDFIKKNHSKFDYVFTMDEELLDISDKFILTLWGGCWIEKEECDIYPKNKKKISIIASKKTLTEGHKLRQIVVSNLTNLVDVYGRGYTTLDNKIDGLKDYEFSIVIENSRPKNYVSEKIIDCFMTGTIPIYWGASNIEEFFDKDGILVFNNIKELINIMRDIISENIKYSDYKDVIKKNFETAKKYVCTEDLIYNNLKELNLC